MKTKNLIIIFIIISLLVSLCLITYIVIDKNKPLNELDNVTIKIKDGTLTKAGATISITDLNKIPDEYGEAFRIDIKKKGQWQELKILNENTAFNLMAYRVSKDGTLELEQNWEYIYGILKKGKYRLVKHVCVKDTACNKKKYFSVEFTIEE